ncbi:putative F-box protein At3g24700 isoform X1 [Gastrolobium bilobum]|uniref:putative F-box protein At3g24700 isoform X1 n=1 Tax=Gastrolobium bilobum TaxID=150636 RepID=UPI002AB15AE2|nr:putative F-box protein At3g24700 isoform X1 [Gastrolobium bilobum]
MVGYGNGNSREEFWPLDVMINILKRVPVKSLIRFKCVAKDWGELFKTPYFIAQHLHHSASNNSYLLLQRIPEPYHQSHPFTFSTCLIGPDLKIHNPQFIDFTSPTAKIVGSCNGLWCVRHTDHAKLSLWNPATRQVRQVPGTLIDIKNSYHIGFGFSPVINDYKIVRISVSEFDDEDQIVVLDNDVRSHRAEVYSLTTGSWKEIDAINLQNLYFISNSVTANGAVFWEATMTSDSESDPDPEFVVSFDIAQEVFTLIKGPPPPPSPTHSYSDTIAVYNNKLTMFRHFVMGNFESSSIDLWVLENTHTCATGESWIKNYSVGPFSRILYPLSIWRDEILCRVELPRHVDEYNGVGTVLSLFNPSSNELKKLPTHKHEFYYLSFNYAESLVPVDNIHYEQ